MSRPARVMEPLVSWEEIRDIELVVLRRMTEFAMGAHPSVFQGAGFDLVGLRDWQPGDRPSAIDWPQSTLTNFSPLLTREFEQESTASVVLLADISLSTRCGSRETSIAKVIARAVATLSMAAAFLQDLVGLIVVDGPMRRLAARPKVGKTHAIHCVNVYQEATHATDRPPPSGPDDLMGLVRQRSVIPVVSDFLLDDPAPMLAELVELGTVHDVFLVMINSAFAFDLPPLSDGWATGVDVETGRSRVLSARELAQMSDRVRAAQDDLARRAHGAGLDVVRIDAGREHAALLAFLDARRTRRR